MLARQILQPDRLRAVSARLRFSARLLTQAFFTPCLEFITGRSGRRNHFTSSRPLPRPLTIRTVMELQTLADGEGYGR
jgi:hypothetical protein